ncbi:MAG: endonuclease/exonuclease/phosphatase family protein [Clostridia bacterium]|nr:endonuclease/exonuclease/phosphatase family protein [Clostridia bacterium]
MSTIRVMSHNKWNCDKNRPAWEEMGLDCSAAHREHGFIRVYQETQPDIIGCQEITPNMNDLMMRYLHNAGMHYALLWGKFTPIVYRPDKFELVDSDFILYPSECPGFEGCFNDCDSKSCALAVFRVKETGKLFIFVTTHLWWKKSNPAVSPQHYQAGSDEARVYQISMLIARADEYQKKYNCPVIVVGDLNTRYNTPALNYAFSQGFVHAHNIAVEYADETSGHHVCGPNGFQPYNDDKFIDAIDHILVRNAPDGFVRRFDRYSPEYYLPLSDHSPVFADIEL